MVISLPLLSLREVIGFERTCHHWISRHQPRRLTATVESLSGYDDDVPYGDTAGAALVIENALVSRGSEDILSGVSWRVMPTERWAIVGPNGAGKSTLLGALVGKFSLGAGKVAVKSGLRVGYLEQTAVSGATTTVREEVASRMDRLKDAESALAACEAALAECGGGSQGESDERGEAHLLDAFVAAQAEFEAAGGLTAEKRISSVLKGLGFSTEEQDRLCAEFSGGWQMRIALARLLLSEPDILLLDEPTNHLDRRARDWVANFVGDYPKTVVVVSHDTELLRVACDSVAEVNPAMQEQGQGVLETYKGMGFDLFLREREQRRKRALSLYASQVEEAAKMQAFIDRFGASATKATQAKDRQKKLERLKASMGPPPPGWNPQKAAGVAASGVGGGGVAAAATNGQQASGTSASPILRLPAPPPVGMYPVRLVAADIGWAGSVDKSNGNNSKKSGEVLLHDVNLAIERKMRLIVRGPNGAGKSTLIHALVGKRDSSASTSPKHSEGASNGKEGTILLRGKRVEEAEGRLRLGYFTQDLAQDLPPDRVALDLVMEAARERFDPLLADEEGRRAMGALGLRGQMALRRVGDLSGGEKARVALAIFCLVPSNVLVLDEPSNHLDSAAIGALTRALQEYEGAVVVISHDRAFAEALQATHVAYINNGAVTLEERALKAEDWKDDIATEATSDDYATSHSGADADVTGDYQKVGTLSLEEEKKSKELRRQAGKVPGLIKKLEAKIETAEEEMAHLDETMYACGTDTATLMELNEKKELLQKKLDAWYKDWEEKEELLHMFPDVIGG